MFKETSCIWFIQFIYLYVSFCLLLFFVVRISTGVSESKSNKRIQLRIWSKCDQIWNSLTQIRLENCCCSIRLCSVFSDQRWTERNHIITVCILPFAVIWGFRIKIIVLKCREKRQRRSNFVIKHPMSNSWNRKMNI